MEKILTLTENKYKINHYVYDLMILLKYLIYKFKIVQSIFKSVEQTNYVMCVKNEIKLLTLCNFYYNNL